jgi:hypothetical protein
MAYWKWKPVISEGALIWRNTADEDQTSFPFCKIWGFFTAATMKNVVFWDVALCRSWVNRRSEERIASIFRVESSLFPYIAWSCQIKLYIGLTLDSFRCLTDCSGECHLFWACMKTSSYFHFLLFVVLQRLTRLNPAFDLNDFLPPVVVSARQRMSTCLRAFKRRWPNFTLLRLHFNHVRWIPCHHGMARPQVADGWDGLQIWRLSANILSMQSRTADKDWSPNFGGLSVGVIFFIIIWFVTLLALRPLLAYCASLGW